jgi:hypothetical protein
MHMREVKDKFPMDAIRLDWESIIIQFEKLLDIDPCNLNYINMILSIKKLYGMDDIEGYIKLVKENREDLLKVGICLD